MINTFLSSELQRAERDFDRARACAKQALELGARGIRFPTLKFGVIGQGASWVPSSDIRTSKALATRSSAPAAFRDL